MVHFVKVRIAICQALLHPLMKSSLTKVVAMCHCPIRKAFHKVVFHMITYEWFVL